jgi:hypothetical protein
MNKTKTDKSKVEETLVVTSEASIPTEEKKTLNGFDMSEFVAQPLDSGISIQRKIINVPAKNQTVNSTLEFILLWR